MCDHNTAICTYGCKEKRTGIYCNNYNIATDALVSQNPIGTKPTNLAIDGDKSTCSKTKGTDVWFQFDMTEIRIVTEFYITGKVNTTTNGLVHKIYASNSSAEPEKGTVLYQGKLLPQNIKTYAVLRYLTYIPAIKTASLELEMCDIGIVGCPSTQYGPLCELRCPAKCLGPCDLDTGRCIFGCLNGWIGEKCDQDMNRKLGAVGMFNILTNHKPEEFKVESLGEVGTEHDDENTCMYQKTSVEFDENRYVEKLPWKHDHETLPIDVITKQRTDNVREFHKKGKDNKMNIRVGDIVQVNDEKP
ncbi:Hypothetical predicted protein [Mytilus galloprovincialis]|uniref:Fucolectin tachylectin-4 pentraxin-1 domain-containing protein n=1 Tax=Mytilus galloprovincialis TaxID=29158 RepID=A0A8B6DXY0_MYTGA|nr:Hypothetical predicted protein [Mytilus galloprovincialis]